jgi:hypothetical protein
MNLDRTWTQFALEAEIDAYGTGRIIAAHEKLRDERDKLMRALVGSLKYFDSHGDNAAVEAYVAANALLARLKGSHETELQMGCAGKRQMSLVSRPDRNRITHY